MMDEDDDPEEENERLLEVVRQLRENRRDLARTMAAIQKKRRTPQEISLLLDRAKRVVQRSVLIRRRIGRALQIH